MNGTTETKPATDEPKPAAPDVAPEAQPSGGPLARVSVRMGLAPHTIEEAWRMAQFMASSELVPKDYRNKPANVLVAIQFGMEVGLPPMAAMQSIYIVNGRPNLWGDGLMAVIVAAPVYKDHDEYFLVAGERREFLIPADLKKDDTAAVTTFWRRDRPRPRTASFSVAQAKQAGLWNKDGPWQTHPDRMLKMRARGFAARDAFPELLRGIRTVEEALDLPAEEVIDTAPIQPRRASEAAATTATQMPAATPVDPVASPQRSEAGMPSAPNGADSGHLHLRGLKITHTGFVKPKDAEPYYEITAKATTGADKTFLTREERVYKEAASFENTDHLVAIECHEESTAGELSKQRTVLVIEALNIWEGQLFS